MGAISFLFGKNKTTKKSQKYLDKLTSPTSVIESYSNELFKKRPTRRYRKKRFTRKTRRTRRRY